MSRGWINWVSVQCASLFSLVAAVFLVMCGLSGHAFGADMSPYRVHAGILAVLFYALHWKLQGKAYALDPVRAERITAIIKMQPSRYEPDW